MEKNEFFTLMAPYTITTSLLHNHTYYYNFPVSVYDGSNLAVTKKQLLKYALATLKRIGRCQKRPSAGWLGGRAIARYVSSARGHRFDF